MPTEPEVQSTRSLTESGARWSLVAAALLFSTGGAVIKLSSLDAPAMAALRSAMAAVTLYVLVPHTRGRLSLPVLRAAVPYAATMILFVFANRMTTAANSVFLQGSAPLWVALLAPILIAERPCLRDWIGFVFMLGGLALFFLDPSGAQETAPDPARGNLFALAAGVTWGLTVLALRSLARAGQPALRAVAAGNVLTAIVALPLAWPLDSFSTVDAGCVLWLGAFQVGLAYVCVARGLVRIPAFEASLLFLLEPTFGPIWAFLLHGEVVGPFAIAGGGVLLGTGMVHAWHARRESGFLRKAPVRGNQRVSQKRDS